MLPRLFFSHLAKRVCVNNFSTDYLRREARVLRTTRGGEKRKERRRGISELGNFETGQLLFFTPQIQISREHGKR